MVGERVKRDVVSGWGKGCGQWEGEGVWLKERE